MTSSKAKRYPVYCYVVVEVRNHSPRHGGHYPRNRVVVIRTGVSAKECLPHKLKRGSGSGDVGGSFRRKGRGQRRSPTPPLQPRPPTLLLPAMAERVQDITATAPVQKNCPSNCLEPTNLTSPVVPSAPSPGHIFYNSEDRSDLHFIVGTDGWRFPVHSFIVGRLRNTLVALLNHAQREADLPEERTVPLVLRLPDVEPEVFEQMLRFIYTGQTSFSSVESALRLLRPSQTFHLPQLAQRCLNHLSASLNTNNVLLILSHLVSPEPPQRDISNQRSLERETNDCQALFPVPSGKPSTRLSTRTSPTKLLSGTPPTQLPFGTSATQLPFRTTETELASGTSTTHLPLGTTQLPFRTPETELASGTSTTHLPLGATQLPFRTPGTELASGTSTTHLPSGASSAQCVPKMVGLARSVSENGCCSQTLRQQATRPVSSAVTFVPTQDVRLAIQGGRVAVSNTDPPRHSSGCMCSQFGENCRSHPCADDFCWHDNIRNELIQKCFQLVDSHADRVLASEAFETLEHPLLMDIVRRDSLAISSEPHVFEALMRWACRTCKRRRKELTPENKCAVLGDALFTVRYLTMTLEDFLRGPVAQGVLSREDKEFFLNRLTTPVNDPLPERWRDSKVCEPRWKRRSPDRSSTDSSPAEVRQTAETSVKSKKKSMSKKLLNGVGDLVICVIQLLD